MNARVTSGPKPPPSAEPAAAETGDWSTFVRRRNPSGFRWMDASASASLPSVRCPRRTSGLSGPRRDEATPPVSTHLPCPTAVGLPGFFLPTESTRGRREINCENCVVFVNYTRRRRRPCVRSATLCPGTGADAGSGRCRAAAHRLKLGREQSPADGCGVVKCETFLMI